MEMDEQPLEPAVVMAEHYIAEDGHRRKSIGLWLGAFGAAMGGAALVMLVVANSPQWFFKPQTVVVHDAPAVGQPLKNQSQAVSKYVPDIESPEVATVAGPPRQSHPSKPPANPFAGARIQTEPMQGSLPSGPVGNGGNYAPINPPVPQGEATSKLGSQEAKLVIARSSGGDVEGDSEQIAQALRSAGASVRIAQHFNLAGGLMGSQLVATISVDALDSATSKLSAVGAHPSDRWSGPVGERGGRVSGMISSRIGELRRAETELKEKFEDDASEVMAVREEIQRLNQCLSAVRAVRRSPKIAVILVSVGSL
jgi:hypothetical protein